MNCRLALVCFAVCAAAQPSRPLETAAVFGPGEVDQLAFSPDGRTLAALTSIGFRVYDTDSGRLLNSVVRPPAAVGELSWSPDGTRFARASGDVEIWNPAGQTPEQVFPAHPADGPFLGLAWSPQGNRLAARYPLGILLIDLASASRTPFPERSDEVQSFSWSPDGRELAVIAVNPDGTSETIEIWDTQQMALLRQHAISAPNESAAPINPAESKVVWSPDGELLAVKSGLTERLGMWDARSLELVREYPATEQIQSLSWSRDRQLLYLGTEREIVFFRPTDGLTAYSAAPANEWPDATLWATAVSADGMQLAAFAGNVAHGEIELWRNRARLPHTRIPWNDAVSAAVLSPDGAQVALRLKGLGKWEVRSTGSGSQVSEVSGADSLSWSPDGAILAARAASHPVQFLRVRDGSPISSFAAAAFAWSPNADLVAEWHNDVRLLRIIGAEVEETIHAPEGHSYWLVSWSPNGRRILLEDSVATPVVYSVDDKTLKPAPGGDGRLIWIGPEELARRPFAPDADFEQSPDLRYAVVGENETWHIQDLRGDPPSSVTLPNVGGRIVWSPDSKQVAYLTTTQELNLWDVAAGRVVEHWQAPGSLDRQDLVWGDRLILCEQLRGAIRIWRRPQ